MGPNLFQQAGPVNQGPGEEPVSRANDSQLTLLSPEPRARARRTDPITSFWAAQGVDVKVSEGLVLNALISGPGTPHDLYLRIIERGHSITPQRVRTALSDMKARGLCAPTGAMGISEHGGKSRVWGRVVG